MQIWLQVTSGQGPDECCWVAARVAEAICKDASANGCKAELIEFAPAGKDGIFKSALISLSGDAVSDFIKYWTGTIQWIGQSMYRANHKRKNWYVGVEVFDVPGEKELSNQDLKFESMRSSGPGGQHTNKTESAVRVTHVPTGLSAVSSDQRSQHMNKKLAVVRLYEKLGQLNQDSSRELSRQRWSEHSALERGNPVRAFAGSKFKEKK